MTLTKSDLTLLSVLYHLAGADRPASVPRLCHCTGWSALAVVEALDRLGHAGLADAERVRLTLPGLALAVASAASSPLQRSQAAA